MPLWMIWTLFCILDDANTLEVMRGLQDVIEIGPKQPRVIIYDVDVSIEKDEQAEYLLDLFVIALDMDDFEKRRIESYLEETDQIIEVWGGESSGDENVVENDNWSDTMIPTCNNLSMI